MMIINQAAHLHGSLTIPGDKSISHRSIMLGSLAKGTSRITHFLPGFDCLSTIQCFQKMGITIEYNGENVTVKGNGIHGLKQPDGLLDCGNSGTTVRLLSGILSAQSFTSVITGDESIKKRPMTRIIRPLSMMGADISSQNGNGCAPLKIKGQRLKGIEYHSPVASAQVKSAILLAGLYAEGTTTVNEPFLSRNHSEIMLKSFGAGLSCHGSTVTIQPAKELYAQDIIIPGDISSAAYFIAAALLVPDSELLIKDVGINPTRDGFLRILQKMGADMTIMPHAKYSSGEQMADILVRTSKLSAVDIEGAVIPTLIDELPILAIIAAFADGTTHIRDAAELKVKESNRIETICRNLSAMGADIAETPDGMQIKGGRPLHGAAIATGSDHRIAMSFTIAGLAASGVTKIDDTSCAAVSYPNFFDELKKLLQPGQ